MRWLFIGVEKSQYLHPRVEGHHEEVEVFARAQEHLLCCMHVRVER